MKLLRMLLRDAPWSTAAAVLAGLASGAANAALLALVNERLTGQVRTSAFLVASFVFLVVLTPLSRILASYLMVRLSQRAVHRLRMDLAGRILGAPLRRLEEVGPHRLQAAFHEDIGTLAVALAAVPMLVVHSTVVLGLLVYLGTISWAALLLLVAFAIGGIGIYGLFATAAMRHQWRARERSDALHEGYQGVIRGTKELKLHATRRRRFLERLESVGDALQGHNVAAATTFAAGGSWTQILVFIALGTVLLGGDLLPVELTAETLTTFTVVVLYLLTPLQTLVNVVPDLVNAEVAHAKTRELGLSLLDGPLVDEDAVSQPESWERIDLVAVRHQYRGTDGRDTFTLGPVNLTLRPGELLFIIGGNGSGKTTLAKLLVGLYAPEEGEVRLDGRPVTEAGLEPYRQCFSAIFSDFYLFEELLGLASEELDGQARQQLARLQLDGKVEVREGRLSTLDLSQGQRKRLALLTACLESRPILVFDEWAADQDPLFREFFYRRLLPDLRDQGKTAVVITHDDRYFDVADQTIKLEYGRIVDELAPVGLDAPRPRAVGDAAEKR